MQQMTSPVLPGPAALPAWLDQFEAEQHRQHAHCAVSEGRWSMARLAFFAAALLVWWPLAAQPWLAGGLMVLGLVLFAVAIRQHTAWRIRRELSDRLLLVIGEARQRLGGKVALVRSSDAPPDAGSDDVLLAPILDDGNVCELTDQERDDLDLFARPVGIFGLLNRTSTQRGARRLRDALNRPMLDAQRIVARQRCTGWLAENGEARLRLMADAAALRKQDVRLERLLRAVHGARWMRIGLPVGLLRLWSVASVVLTVLLMAWGATGSGAAGAALGALLLVNAVLYFQMRPELHAALSPWRDTAWAARGLLAIAQRAAADLPQETELASLREPFAAAARSAALPALTRRLGWTESGGIVGLLLNIVSFADLHVAQAVLRSAVPNRDALLGSAAALADLELLLSLACMAAESPRRCLPQPVDGVLVEIHDGVHPLIDPGEAVPNSVLLDGERRVWVVTGSNMAGKSTLLRMLGTNVLLAHLGAAVTADGMRFSPLRLITDLRARDSLAAHESYFLAEVRHLRRMVLPPAGQEPILGLIDEPFRGTNSHDQTAASLAVVQHLLESPHLFVVATHDRHLTDLADGRLVQNFHFRENLGRGGMVFDYRLHPGPATTRNALLVLEREGYPASLLKRAHAWGQDAAPEPSDTGSDVDVRAKSQS